MKRILILEVRTAEESSKLVRRLAPEEYQRGVKAVATLMNLELERSLIDIVRLNQTELKNQLAALHDHSWNPSYVQTLAGRVLLNYLSSTRFYVDQMQRVLTRRFGHGSKEIGQFRLALAKAYDTSFAYRFLSRLRNYVQHRGLPYTTMSHVCIEGPTSSSPGRFRTTFRCSPKRLLHEYDGWGGVKAELKNRSRDLPIFSYISKMTRCLEKLDQTVLELLAPDVVRARQTIIEICGKDWRGKQFLFTDLTKVAHSVRTRSAKGPMFLRSIPVPGHILTQVGRWTLPNTEEA